MKLTLATTTVLSLCLGSVACAPERPAVDDAAIDTAAVREKPPSPAPTASTAPAPTLDPCALVSRDELRQITGLEFSPGRQTASEPGLVRCAWAPADTTQDAVAIALHTGDPSAAWNRYFAMPGTQALPDLGDEAIVNTAMQHVVVRRDDAVLVVSPNLHQGEIRRAGEAIARTILPRIAPASSQ